MDLTADDPDELIDFWTLLDEDRELLAGKRGATALGFALLLKHYSRHRAISGPTSMWPGRRWPSTAWPWERPSQPFARRIRHHRRSSVLRSCA